MMTILQLKEQISNDLKNELNLSDDDLKKVLDAFSSVLAAQFKLTYLALNDVQRNLFPDTADLAENGGTLDRLGRIYLNRDIRPATSAIINLSVTGESGSVLRAGLTFKSNEDALNAGKLYILDSEYIMTGTNDVIEVRSLGGGLDFALQVGNNLTITEPIIGVDKTVLVDSIDTEPVAGESVNEFRTAILNAIQLEPQGGAKTDYIQWANDAAGVRKVYPFLKENEAGTVQIFVEASDADGTPTSGILTEVEEVINFDPDQTRPLSERGRKPIQVNLEVLPIDLIEVEINIVGLQENTTDIQNAIESNIITYLKTVRPFVDGADLARNKNDILYAAKLQSVVTDVIDSDNFFTDFVMFIDGVNQTTFQFNKDKIPKLININYL